MGRADYICKSTFKGFDFGSRCEPTTEQAVSYLVKFSFVNVRQCKVQKSLSHSSIQLVADTITCGRANPQRDTETIIYITVDFRNILAIIAAKLAAL
jgi:hypothetical protein